MVTPVKAIRVRVIIRTLLKAVINVINALNNDGRVILKPNF